VGTVTNTSVFEIASSILEYLEKSPHAEDTYKGILEWWILQKMIELDAKDVKQAIRELVSRDLLIASEGSDKQILYHLNPESIEAAKAFRQQESERTLPDTELGEVKPDRYALPNKIIRS
jgi:hypothetical protein